MMRAAPAHCCPSRFTVFCMCNYSTAVMYNATLAILHKVASATLHKVALATHKHALICCVCQCHGTFMVEPRIQT